jgi:DNA-binding MarR family transcriptional regulator
MTAAKKGASNPLTSLHRLEFILQHKSDLILRDSLGVGFGQIQIMQELNRSVPMTQRALAAKLHQTEANVSRQLKLLKRKGLVNIGRNKQDKRLHETSLTAKGNKTYAKAERLLATQHKELLKPLDKKAIQSFDRTASHLLKSLE